MRPSRVLFNAAKKSSGFNIPVELTPLFVAMGIACTSAIYFSYRKFAYDGSLRLSRSNPKQSSADLQKYLKEEPVVEAAEEAAEPVVEAVEEAAEPVVEAVKEAAEPAVEAATEAAAPVVEAVTEAVEEKSE